MMLIQRSALLWTRVRDVIQSTAVLRLKAAPKRLNFHTRAGNQKPIHTLYINSCLYEYMIITITAY